MSRRRKSRIIPSTSPKTISLRLEQVNFLPSNPHRVPHSQTAAFERFYKVDKSHQQDNGGAGLGLAIVRQIIDLHKARVNVVSEPGAGTRIELE